MARKNGFQTPFHSLQVLSWLIAGLNFSEFFIILPLIPEISAIPFAVLYTFVMVFLTITCVYVTASNPESYSIQLSKDAAEKGESLDKEDFPQLCNICNAFIKRQTKHCGNCQKCVENFDHHCKWVNNCIGSRNYRTFIVLMILALLSHIVFTVENLALIFTFISSPEDFTEKSEDAYSIHGAVFLIASLIFLLESIAVLCGLLYLLSFHVWVRSRSMTTYDYIIKRREQRNMEYSVTEVVKEPDKDHNKL